MAADCGVNAPGEGTHTDSVLRVMPTRGLHFISCNKVPASRTTGTSLTLGEDVEDIRPRLAHNDPARGAIFDGDPAWDAH